MSLALPTSRRSRRSRARSRLAEARIDVKAAWWIARGLWRMLRGRAPWRAGGGLLARRAR